MGGRKMGRPKRLGSVEDVIREDFTYKPDTGELFRKGKLVQTVSTKGYLVSNVQGKVLYGHRISWFLYHGSWPEHGLDHINRVKTDNRINNLRDVPQVTNLENTGLRKNNKSGYKHVSWDSTRGMWCLRKHSSKGYKFLGYFNCPTSAYIHLQEIEFIGETKK